MLCMTISKEELEIFDIVEYAKLHNFLHYEEINQKNVQPGLPTVFGVYH